ncbi:MAG TPA: extracellular solute-binding protein, partial [Limnochordia bacterium]
DLRPYLAADEDEVEPTDFYPGDFRAGIVQSGPHAGERFGLPRYTNASVIFFNRTAFDAAGVTAPDRLAQQGAWTWDALRDAARKLTLRAEGRVTRYGYRTFFGDARFMPWVWGAGGALLDGPRQVAIDRPAAIAGLNYLHALIWEDEVATFQGAFERGEIAFREQGSKDMGPYGNVIGDAFEWDIAPLPAGPAGVQGNWVAGDMWAISRTTKHPEAAWEFLKFLTSTEGMEIMTRLTGLPPSRFSAYDALRDAYRERNVVYHLQAASTARVLPFSVVPAAKDVSRIIDETIRASLERNALPIESAAKQAAERIRAIYAQRR